MFEYRYGELSEETLLKLEDMGIYPIEESFVGESVCNIIYFDETLPEIIDEEYVSRVDVEETGWEEKWKEFIHPGFLTDTIRYEFDTALVSDENTIIINPSMAFGTGTHPTTRCAARLLEHVCEGKNVMDIGCGSGILALTAAKRGAKEVFAFDNDPVALVNTYENIKLNNIDNMHAWVGEIGGFKGEVDVVVANIITSVLKIIHPDVMKLKPEYIVYSGILDSECEGFISALDLEGYDVVDTSSIEEWRGVLIKCR
ncbi:MAG: 50S ribosomal protein L11 methyltransferase [Deferribacterales bacterium]|jgi:ribosomal protein L11 methyltransferase